MNDGGGSGNWAKLLLLLAGWGAWFLWAVAYVGFLLVAVIPFSGNLIYCVADDGSPSGSVSLSLIPFGPQCTDLWGETSGPPLVWTVWLLVGVAALIGLSGATERLRRSWRQSRALDELATAPQAGSMAATVTSLTGPRRGR